MGVLSVPQKCLVWSGTLSVLDQSPTAASRLSCVLSLRPCELVTVSSRPIVLVGDACGVLVTHSVAQHITQIARWRGHCLMNCLQLTDRCRMQQQSSGFGRMPSFVYKPKCVGSKSGIVVPHMMIQLN